jgi:hypothetical protein
MEKVRYPKENVLRQQEGQIKKNYGKFCAIFDKIQIGKIFSNFIFALSTVPNPMINPGSEFFFIPDPNLNFFFYPGSALTQTIDSKLSEI